MFSPTAAFVRFRGVQNASTETRFNGITVPDGTGEKGGNGGEAGYNHCRGYAIFFLSRVMLSFSHGACVIQL